MFSFMSSANAFYVDQSESKLCCVVNPFPNKPWFLTSLQYKSFENTVGKGKIARDKQFLLHPECFQPCYITICHFHLVWKGLKIVVWERVKNQ